jgi:hypothetical protein
MLVVLLLGLLLLREPRFAAVEERFLSWLIRHSQGGGAPVPLTVVEIGEDPLMAPKAGAGPAANANTPPASDAGASAVSPLEFALFLQSALDFQPGVIAFENILRWRARDRDQEQVFLDQAMRVPKLLLAAELGAQTDPDAPVAEIRGFPQVTGRRGDLPAFSAVNRQPGEDLRLISTAGYINFPEEITSNIRVPLLFQYRGEVIPSFTLQAILLWLRVTPADVKIVLGSHIALPQDRKVPISADGSLLVDPTASRRARRLSLNELLLAAQQRDSAGTGDERKLDLQDQIVLARTPANPLSPPDLFAAAIATIQSNKYLRRVHVLFDCVLLLLIGAIAGSVRRVDRVDLLLYGIAFTAAYCLVAIGMLSRWSIWLPGVLPLATVWLLIIIGMLFRDKAQDAREAGITIPPPIA